MKYLIFVQVKKFSTVPVLPQQRFFLHNLHSLAFGAFEAARIRRCWEEDRKARGEFDNRVSP